MKIPISFKNSEMDNKLLEFLKKKSAIIGTSAYIKQMLYEQMLKEEKDDK